MTANPPSHPFVLCECAASTKEQLHRPAMVANSELSYVPSSQLKILHILLFNVDVTVPIFEAKLREIEHIPQHHIVSGKKGLCADLAD